MLIFGHDRNMGRSRMILRYCPNSILITRRVSTTGRTTDVRCERYTHEVPRQNSHPCSSGERELDNSRSGDRTKY